MSYQDKRPCNVTLTEEVKNKAKQLGRGNVSAGIRFAVLSAATGTQQERFKPVWLPDYGIE